jgi:GNAT superfamily N-acetyltransferase
MDIVFREGHDVDLDRLAALFASVGWQHRLGDRERLAQLVSGSRYAVSALEGAELVGFARAISDGAFNAYVSTVVVAPSHRGRGLGRGLVRALVEGREHLQFVLHAAEGVHGFYARLGFAPAPDMLWRRRER